MHWWIYVLYRPVVTICTAHWSLYVPSSGHYMLAHIGHYTYRTVATIRTAHWSICVPSSGLHMLAHSGHYTGCHRRNGPNFGRVFLMLNYTDITQNTYIQSRTVTEIMAREKCGHLAFPRNVRLHL